MIQIAAGTGAYRPSSHRWALPAWRERAAERPAAPVAELPSEPDRVLFDAAEAMGRSLGLAYVGIELAEKRATSGAARPPRRRPSRSATAICRSAGCAPRRAVDAR